MQSVKLIIGHECWCIVWGLNCERFFSTLGAVRQFHKNRWGTPLSTGNQLVDELLPGDTTPAMYRAIEEDGYFHD